MKGGDVVLNYRKLVWLFTCITSLLLTGCGLSNRTITVRTGDQERPAGPVCVNPGSEMKPGSVYMLQLGENARLHPAQVDADGGLWFWSNEVIPAHEQLTCELSAVGKDNLNNTVTLRKSGKGQIEVTIDGEQFTTFNYGEDLRIPFLYPVIGPTGEGVTRDFPMRDVKYEREHKRQDHQHHQSLWTAWGDLRTKDFDTYRTNYWHSAPTAGRQVVTDIQCMVSGPVFGQLTAKIEWRNPGRGREMTEYRTFTFFRGNDDERIIDVQVKFEFTNGDVMFADTKEGGLLSLRLSPEMDEVGGGRMRNSNKQVGHGKCWGQAAAWCDYVGPLKGKTVGVAVMDHPSNFRHPTRWHIRNYGLYAANPFGLSHFVGKDQNGSKVWKKGESVAFNYRVLIHKGDTEKARVSEHFYNYANPLKQADQ